MDQNPQIKRRKMRKIPKVLLNQHASVVVVNNIMKEEQGVPHSSKSAASVRKRATFRVRVPLIKKAQQFEEDK